MIQQTIISSNCFFHFTSRFENIVNIIRKGFQPRYCLEKTSYFQNEKINETEMAYPIVSFCDIPISKIQNHIGTYGNYGIGLKKEWGFKNILSPIFYVKNNSLASGIFDGFINYTQDLVNIRDDNFEIQPYKNLISYLMTLTKPYDGYSYNLRKKDYVDYVKYYDEREWRYIPLLKKEDEKIIRLHLEKDEFLNEQLRKQKNEQIAEKYSLNFEIEDLKYIFLKSNEQKIQLINRLRQFLERDKLELLATKMISKDFITEDI